MRSRTNRRHAGDGTLAAIGNLPRAAVAALFAAMLLVLTSPALAAPEAKILRIDPRAAQTDGAPIITTVVEVAQRKRISDATADCAYMRGDAQLTCMGERLAQPGALFTPFSFPPKENVIFTVAVDGADQPAKFVDAYKWEQAQNIQGVGTAWLIVIDAAGSMGARFGDAQQVALAFINSMQAQDIANVTVIGERGIITDSKWQPASAKAQLATAVTSARELPKEGRARPLMTTIRAAATDGFKDLGNAGTSAAVPLHQAMVVLSNGQAGGDVSTNGLGATQLAQYLTKGRFPEDNPTAPKMPLPVISILFPTGGLSEEFTKNAQDFMTNLANPEIGGYFGVVRGNGAAMGVQIVNTVRYRFNQMWVVRWRVSCVAPTVLQTFNLLFKDVNPQIAPDGYKDVPVGIDPTTWPLDVNVAYTAQMAKRDPVYPGGSFKVYGDFCWGSNAQRAAVYFIPKDTAPPAAISGRDVEGAKKAQQQLVARKMDGKAIKAADTFVEFEAPESETILIGKGEQAVVRVVLYDNVARRMSGVTANTILTLKGSEKPLPIVMIVAASFGGLVVILLIVAIIRGGGSKKQRGGPPQGPSGGYAPPGPAPYGPPGGGPPGYGQPAGGPPPGYGQAGAPPPGYGAAAAPPAYAPPPVPAGAPPGGTAVLGAPGAPGAPAPAAASPDFMYGGKPPQYGLTTAQPQGSAPPPDPYGGAPAGGGTAFAQASRATLSGAAGVFTILPGSEMRVGRDAAQCQIVFQEARVSGFHATVKLEGGQFLVRDEGSNNGTHVNGTRLAPKVWMPVPPGSMVRFGPVELSVRIE